MTPTVVFDCMILLQAAANPVGEAGRCYNAVESGSVQLTMSQATRYEAHDVLTREAIRLKLPRLTAERVEEFLDSLDYFSRQEHGVPQLAQLPRDPKDEKYLNLAIAANAQYLVTRDNDLLDLMKDGGFRSSYPNLEILGPAEFLERMTLM